MILQKIAVVLGAGGFIGGHLVKRLKERNYIVIGVDIKYPEYLDYADKFVICDLRDQSEVRKLFSDIIANHGDIDELYQLAADMGGAGYIFTGENDANVMHNSALINLNVVEECIKYNVKKVFYSSSACIYPAYNQENPDNPNCEESSAYPANPDSEYGWEKLFSERLYLAFNRNYNLDVRIARFHNIFGPYGTWRGGKEKAPAAICRKVSELPDNGELEIWGNGIQTRSFLYIDSCLDAVQKFMEQDKFVGPINIGSEEMISINNLAKMVINISGKNLTIKNIYGEEFIKKYGHRCPIGVMGRNSSNKLYREIVGWEVDTLLKDGIEKLYNWINSLEK